MAEIEIKRIAAVADIHVKGIDKGKWAPYFKEVSRRADVLLICGDLTDTGDEDEAKILAEDLKSCTIPVVCVLGNHDHEKGRHKLIRQILQNDHVHVLDGECFVIGNIGFAGVKGFGGGFDHHLLSMFGEAAMKAFVQEAVDESLHLERALARLDASHTDFKKIVLLHYAPIRATVIGEAEQIYPFLGCSRLAEPLHQRDVTAVFHGHAHGGSLEGFIGDVKVYNVALPVLSRSGFTDSYYLLEL